MAAAMKTAQTAYDMYKMQKKFKKMTTSLGKGGKKHKVNKPPSNPMLGSKPGPRGNLLLSVVEGHDLKGADLIGKSDPYCIISVGTQVQKTKVISNNLNPVWNQDFQFNVDGERFITIKVMDRDRFKKDDFLGELVLKVKDFDSEDIIDDFFELDTYGSIRLQLQFYPSLIGDILVKVIEARNLEKMDVVGKSDPFCIIRAGTRRGDEKKTKTVKRTLEPKWNQQFQLKVRGDTFLDVFVYDWDRATKNDFMGECMVRASVWESGQVVDDWYELHGKSESQGSIHLQMQFTKDPSST